MFVRDVYFYSANRKEPTDILNFFITTNRKEPTDIMADFITTETNLKIDTVHKHPSLFCQSINDTKTK